MLSSSSLSTPADQTSADMCLSPALQAYLRNCVRERLQSEGQPPPTPWFHIHLYLRLGDAASAISLDRDLRSLARGGPLVGLIALFGQLAPGLDIQTAEERQLNLMQGCDRQLRWLTPPRAARSTQIFLGSRRYTVLALHEHASRLHRVMPCPMLVFSPLE